MKAVAVFLVVLSCLAGAPAARGQGTVTLDLHDVPIDVALRGLFSQTGTQYSVAPEVQGTVTLDLQDVPLEGALRAILNQVGGTYRIVGGVFEIVKRGPIGPGTDPSVIVFVEGTPEFRPGEFSGSYGIRNKGLFLTPHRTMGGTYGLLAEAAWVAGLDDWSVYRYGDNGFALVLPFEAILENGRPRSGAARFGFRPNTRNYDFRKIAELWQNAGQISKSSYRALVLLVTSDTIRPGGSVGAGEVSRPFGTAGMPDSLRKRKWAVDPKLTVLVYEFRGTPRVLLKKGESKIGAKDHILASGLWTAKQLR